MKQEVVVNGVLRFVEMELLPMMEGTRKWAGAFGLGLIRNQANTIVNNVLKQPHFAMFGIVTADGEIDVETLLTVAKETAKTQGALELNIPVIGKFGLGEATFDSLEEYIKEQDK